MKVVFLRCCLIALISMMAVGCATREQTVWVKPGSTEDEFLRDRGQCIQATFSVPFATAFQQTAVFVGCMQGKGWREEKRSIVAPPVQNESLRVVEGRLTNSAQLLAANGTPYMACTYQNGAFTSTVDLPASKDGCPATRTIRAR